MANNMSDAQRRKAGRSHFDYIRELLERDGDKATINLHADHMRSLLSVHVNEGRRIGAFCGAERLDGHG